MIPTKEDIEKFKAELSQMSAEEVGQKLRHHAYGAKDNWKYKEAQSECVSGMRQFLGNIKLVN
jgi:hypothetical protein